MNPYSRLAAAVVLTAFQDLQRPKHAKDAESFLRSDWCDLILDTFGLEQNAIPEVIQRIKNGNRFQRWPGTRK